MELRDWRYALTARLRGELSDCPTVTVIDPLVCAAEDAEGLLGLEAAWQLAVYLIGEANTQRTQDDAPSVGDAEERAYVRAALTAIAGDAWEGRYPSPGAWAKTQHALTSLAAPALPGAAAWSDAIDWEGIGLDWLDAVGYLVVCSGTDRATGPVWVYRERPVRAAVRAELRHRHSEDEVTA